MGLDAKGRIGYTVVVSAVAVSAVVVGAALGSMRAQAPAPWTGEGEPTTTPATTIDVHVAGWVVSPGVVVLPEGSIVVDAIEAAGGLKPGAAPEAVNLAAPVRSGDQILVPGPGGLERSAVEDSLVAVNRASAAELERLPGVGSVLAERIVAHREANGPFGEVEDLLDVQGIGESKLASMRDLIRVP